MTENRNYTENNRDFYLAIPDFNSGGQRISIQAPTDTSEDTGIRLHCVQYDQQWCLQIRGFFRTANFRKGKKWYYARADLGVDQLRALRDACNTALSKTA